MVLDPSAGTASLPWYPSPVTRAAEDRLWSALQDRVRLPARSEPNDLLAHWRDPAMVLSQTCTPPYRRHLADRVTLVAAPDFGLPDCPPGDYASVLVQRSGDDRGQADWPSMRLAVNDRLSQSGFGAPTQYAAARGTRFGDLHLTGAHRVSIRAVADGLADIAAIDAQTWRLLSRHDPVVARLKVVARTAPTPAPPYITGDAALAPVLFAALSGALASLSPDDRGTLGLYGIVAIRPGAYDAPLQSPTASSLFGK